MVLKIAERKANFDNDIFGRPKAILRHTGSSTFIFLWVHVQNLIVNLLVYPLIIISEVTY